MTDPLLASAREVLRRTRADMRASIEGIPPDALNWRPAGNDTNSIAVLATHSLTSTRWWLSVAVDAPIPDRDRPTEFEASARDAGELLALTGGLFEDCLSLVDGSRTVDWAAVRSDPDAEQDQQFPAAWAVLHALQHIREHEGQMSLTRQLWERRAAERHA
ncbi:MAG: DinB family protein [Dehalococcoidia bacterium]